MPGNCSSLRSFVCRKASRSFGFCHARDPSDRRLPIINPAFVLSPRCRRHPAENAETKLRTLTENSNPRFKGQRTILDPRQPEIDPFRLDVRHGRLFRFLCADARDSGVRFLQIGADRDL